MSDFGGKSYPYPGAPPTGDEKQIASLAHFLGVLGPIAPLVVWLIKKDHSDFARRESFSALTWTVGLIVVWLATSVIAMIPVVGCVICVVWPVLIILQIVYPILGGLRAQNGLCYEYPIVSGFFPPSAGGPPVGTPEQPVTPGAPDDQEGDEPAPPPPPPPPGTPPQQ